MEIPNSKHGWQGYVVRCLSIGMLVIFAPTAARSGFITTQTAAVNAIYSQASFGATPVEIRFNPGLSFVRPDLLDIDTLAKEAALIALAPAASPVVDAFYVDSITSCGGPAPGFIVGCAQRPGHVLWLNSLFAASTAALGGSTDGAVDIGHEVGHNLDLPHIGGASSTGNLMNPFLNSDVLLVAQVTTILASPLIQIDPLTGARFVSITPIAIVATEPSAFAVLGAGLIILAIMWRRRLPAA